MNKENISRIIDCLEDYTEKYELPMAILAKEWKSEPFKILISIMLSSRTKDDITAKASVRLFSKAKILRDLEKMPLKEIESLIYPVNFYKTKALHVKDITAMVRKNFGGKVPDDFKGLTSLPGVGPKTANLVLNIVFGKDYIGVDTHVHQILNRIGYVQTKNPEETESQLKKKLPKKYWRNINVILVLFGQNICVSASPFCSRCPVKDYCLRIGVKKSR
jgi:endonuclease-3